MVGRSVGTRGLAVTLAAMFVVCTAVVGLDALHGRPRAARVPGPEPEKTSSPVANPAVVRAGLVSGVVPATLAKAELARPSHPPNTEFVGSETETAKLETRFQRDYPATAESRQREGELRSAFSGPVMEGATLDAVECRASMCRVGLTFPNVEIDKDVGRRFFLDPRTQVLPKMGVTIPKRIQHLDGTVEATVYFDGSPPPPPAETTEGSE